MDLLAARQRVTASNHANADTPGYRSREIDFRLEVQSLAGTPQIRESLGDGAKNDANNVNVDRELQNLAENTMRFQVASLLLRNQIRGVMNAIREGRGGL
jgi:flagellar basal-body rod protein FlgB